MTVAEREQTPRAIPATIGGHPTSILLVDDEPFNLDLLEQELDAFELQIVTASNGQEALDRVAESAPGAGSRFIVKVPLARPHTA